MTKGKWWPVLEWVGVKLPKPKHEWVIDRVKPAKCQKQ